MLKTTISSTANNMFQEKDKIMEDGNEEFSLNIESLKIKHVSLFLDFPANMCLNGPIMVITGE